MVPSISVFFEVWSVFRERRRLLKVFLKIKIVVLVRVCYSRVPSNGGKGVLIEP